MNPEAIALIFSPFRQDLLSLPFLYFSPILPLSQSLISLNIKSISKPYMDISFWAFISHSFVLLYSHGS